MRFAGMLIGITCLTATLVAADFTGTWKLNLAKSQGTNDLVSFIIKIEQTGPNMYRTTVDTVVKSGEKGHQEINRIYDGEEHPMTGEGIPEGASEICQFVDASTRKITQKRGGKVVSELTATMSSDGKVTTLHRTGNREEHFILEKQ
jgi:hypothetical protein